MGTVRTYAGRLALYLTWAGTAKVDPAAPSAEQLAGFARWLERTPSRKHRPGRQRRRAPDPKIVALAPARSAATVEGVRAAVVEFVRFGADLARGMALAPVLDELEQRAAELEADNHRQREQIVRLEADARELTETLEAARAMNRELMTELNRPWETRPDRRPPSEGPAVFGPVLT